MDEYGYVDIESSDFEGRLLLLAVRFIIVVAFATILRICMM